MSLGLWVRKRERGSVGGKLDVEGIGERRVGGKRCRGSGRGGVGVDVGEGEEEVVGR